MREACAVAGVIGGVGVCVLSSCAIVKSLPAPQALANSFYAKAQSSANHDLFSKIEKSNK